MKKTLGYGIKLPRESWEYALSVYKDGGYLKNKKEIKEEIKQAKLRKDIRPTTRPIVFKVTVEFQK